MTPKLCWLVTGVLAVAGMLFVSSPSVAMTKQEALKECQALYGGRANFNKRSNTGMTVQGCVNQKMGGKSQKKK